MTSASTPSRSMSLTRSLGSHPPGRASLYVEDWKNFGSSSGFFPAPMPWARWIGGMPSSVKYAPGLRPGGFSTTRGARSRNGLSMRSTHRSPGSLTCESAEISLSSLMSHLDFFGWGPRHGPQTPNVRRAPADPWRSSSTLYLNVLVRCGERVAGDDADARLLDARADAADAGVQPDRRDHDLVVYELLDP